MAAGTEPGVAVADMEPFLRLVWLLSLCFLTVLAADEGRAATNLHEIAVRLDPGTGAIEIVDRFPHESRSALHFELAPWLIVTGARLDGRELDVRRDQARWTVPIPPQDRGELEIAIRGQMPTLGETRWLGGTAAAAAGPDGAFLPAAAGWLPLSVGDPIAYRLIVSVPAPHRAVATGRLVEESAEGGINSATFESEHAQEPPSVFAGPYAIAERETDGVRLRTYLHGDVAGLADTYLTSAGRYIARYADEIGAYPYADFHIISAPLPVGLGFPNLTYIGRRVLPLPFMRGRSLAHEVLHNWWGNGVGIEFPTGNWAEGLTTFMADYALAAEEDGAAQREMRLGWLRDYAALPAERDIPVVEFTSKTHDAAQVIGYGKVAFVFDMLRQDIGADSFREGVRAFWADYRFRTAGWADLRGAFERAAGRDLGWFFDQWLGRAGAPSLELADAGRRRAEQGYRIALSLSQNTPPYRLRVPIVIETAGGEKRSEIVLDEARREIEIALAERPLAVRVDPNFQVFRRLLPGESPPIFRDITLSEDALVMLTSADAPMRIVALQLAERMLQRAPKVYQADRHDPAAAPLLVIGRPDEIVEVQAEMGFATPTRTASGGSTRAWTAVRAGGPPALFVDADDPEALAAVMRPLPHYLNRSYVVFDGAKAIDKGVWPPADSPLSRTFEE